MPSPPSESTLFIFGISGHVGSRLAQLAIESKRFAWVSGSALHGLYAENAHSDGGLSLQGSALLSQATHVISTVAPDATTHLDPILASNALPVIQANAQNGKLVWCAYLSTTAVYGDRQGGLARESDNDDSLSLSPRGKARLQCENDWNKLTGGAPMHVFRLPGIYGPGQGPLVKARQAKQLVFKRNHVFCRVHVDDVCRALLLSMFKPNPGRVYNVCDDEPAASHDVSLKACKLLGIDPTPPLIDIDQQPHLISDTLKSFYAESRLVNNARLRRELGFTPLYPSYREGLVACLAVVVADGASGKRHAAATARHHPSPPLRFAATSSRLLHLFLRALHRLIRAFMWRFWFQQRTLVVLVDNGSLRPGATLAMRRLCEQLRRKFPGLAALPMSARYADRIPPTDLQGQGAAVISREALASSSSTTIVPMFLGPSDTIAKDLKPLTSPQICITKPLVDFDATHESCLITQCLVRAYLMLSVPRPTRVVLVDHGSPSRQVTRVRRALAARLRLALLPSAVREVVDCSMERRPGEEYAFNDPLLENVFDCLVDVDDHDQTFALLPAFLFLGNHAGKDGDLAQILRGPVKTKHPDLKITMAQLIGAESNDDLLLELIASRVITT